MHILRETDGHFLSCSPFLLFDLLGNGHRIKTDLNRMINCCALFYLFYISFQPFDAYDGGGDKKLPRRKENRERFKIISSSSGTTNDAIYILIKI